MTFSEVPGHQPTKVRQSSDNGAKVTTAEQIQMPRRGTAEVTETEARF